MGSKTKRFVVAFATGLIAFLVTVLVVWQTIPKTLATYIHFQGGATRYKMGSLKREIRIYKSKHQGKAPTTLAEVARQTTELKDGWGRLFLYEHTENNEIIKTLGRDGKPGGVGLDEDFTSENMQVGYPTLGQVFQGTGESEADSWVRACWTCCFLNGLFWSLALLFSKEEEVKNKALNNVGLLIVFVVTVLGAVFMAALDVPTGH